jgi:ADP-heptose:LPS heptosyltransferase
MNFPGLDLAWTYGHHAGHAMRIVRTWPLEEVRTAVERGDKILVVASTALGDSILTTPLIETLSERLGKYRVSLLVKAPYAGLYEKDPRLNQVLTVRGKYRWAGLREKLESDQHTIALISNATEPDLIPYLWQCGVRGFLRYRTRWSRFPNWMANGPMMRRPGSSGYATGHAIENNLAMAKVMGVEPSTHKLSLPHLRGKPESRENRIIIHPGASREIKRWPVENWARLGDALASKFGCKIVITGDRNEVSLAVQIASAMKTPVQTLAGKLSLTELAQLEATSLAFLSGDTGPYHLAIAVGCPTVTIFAPTDRGSSMEACGPHQANALFHRAIQTARLGDPIRLIPTEKVLSEASAVLSAVLAKNNPVATGDSPVKT